MSNILKWYLDKQKYKIEIHYSVGIVERLILRMISKNRKKYHSSIIYNGSVEEDISQQCILNRKYH